MTTLFGPWGALLPNPEGTKPFAGSKKFSFPKPLMFMTPLTLVPIKSAKAGDASAIHIAVAGTDKNNHFDFMAVTPLDEPPQPFKS